MTVEILFYNRTDLPDSLYDIGDFVCVRPGGHIWGESELIPNKFFRVTITDGVTDTPAMDRFQVPWEDTTVPPDDNGDFPLIKRFVENFDESLVVPPAKRDELRTTGHVDLTFGQLVAVMRRKSGA